MRQMELIPPVQSAISVFQVQPVKAMCWENPMYSYIENIWHKYQLDQTERCGWASRHGATRAWARATHCLIINYVTAFFFFFSYCFKSHSVQCAWCSRSVLTHSRCWVGFGALLAGCYAGCWGLTFKCWGCPKRPIRCFCFLCSVIWKAPKKFRIHPTCNLHSYSWALPLNIPLWLTLFIDSITHTTQQKGTNMCAPFAALCSDESSRTLSTNCETLSHKIS